MAYVEKREPFLLVVGMMYLFKSIYIQKLTTLLLSQAVAQSDEKKYRWRSVVGYFNPTIAFSSFLIVFAVSPLHVDALPRK
jgi:hypothetical protein